MLLFSARASFNRIRVTTRVIVLLLTSPTQRMVRSRRPLSILLNTRYQTRFLRARVFSPASFPPVSGDCRNCSRFDSSFNERSISLSLDDLPQIVQNLLLSGSFSLPSSQHPSCHQSGRHSDQRSVEEQLCR